MNVPVWLIDFGDAVVWAATVSVVWFVVQYTLSSPWWRDPVGRTVVAKDVALLLLLIPSCLLMAWPHLMTPLDAEVVGVTALSGVTVSMAWRCAVWWAIQPPRLRRKKPISTGESDPRKGSGHGSH